MHDRITRDCHWRVIILGAFCATIGGYAMAQSEELALPNRPRGPKMSPVNDLNPLSFRVNYVYRARGKSEPKQIENGSVLQSGDHYKIQFTPGEHSYVYIFQIDGAGKIDQLFPMEKWKSITLKNRNPVAAGVTYFVPAEDKSFVLDEQLGFETIYFLAARRENPNITRLADQLREARRLGNELLDASVQSELNRELAMRGVAKIVEDPKVKIDFNWHPGETFKVSEQRLNDMCSQCSHAVTFRHR